MISVDEARALVEARARPLGGTEETALGDALGRVLAGPVLADRDDPPFDRSMMDGYAVRAGEGPALQVVGSIAAGEAEPIPVGPGQAAWINTGAPVPEGADAVVPVEQTQGQVEILQPVERGANILRRGTLVRAGDTVARGILTPDRLAVCAAVGADPVRVRARPRVAVLATGNELRSAPGAHEIRNSNGPIPGSPSLDGSRQARTPTSGASAPTRQRRRKSRFSAAPSPSIRVTRARLSPSRDIATRWEGDSRSCIDTPASRSTLNDSVWPVASPSATTGGSISPGLTCSAGMNRGPTTVGKK